MTSTPPAVSTAARPSRVACSSYAAVAAFKASHPPLPPLAPSPTRASDPPFFARPSTPSLARTRARQGEDAASPGAISEATAQRRLRELSTLSLVEAPSPPSKPPPRRRHPSCPSPARLTACTRAPWSADDDAVPCAAPQALPTAAARHIALLAGRGIIGASKASRRLLPPGRLPRSSSLLWLPWLPWYSPYPHRPSCSSVIAASKAPAPAAPPSPPAPLLPLIKLVPVAATTMTTLCPARLVVAACRTVTPPKPQLRRGAPRPFPPTRAASLPAGPSQQAPRARRAAGDAAAPQGPAQHRYGARRHTRQCRRPHRPPPFALPSRSVRRPRGTPPAPPLALVGEWSAFRCRR
ncbi:hypothetical protein B0H15DRAFT_955429 [Mycena belliarum]|uniref:Uncharacterized protein n=1 Tax=Mycena belliarum TaxID=1033014 RepID=A0AAD6XID6_9AGAR|nr:hypothetical protein B0H15DRAFT_955429 [Mycena belliae]